MSSGRKKRNDPDASPAEEETDDKFTERRFVALETGMNKIGEHMSNISTRQSDTDVKLDKTYEALNRILLRLDSEPLSGQQQTAAAPDGGLGREVRPEVISNLRHQFETPRPSGMSPSDLTASMSAVRINASGLPPKAEAKPDMQTDRGSSTNDNVERYLRNKQASTGDSGLLKQPIPRSRNAKASVDFVTLSKRLKDNSEDGIAEVAMKFFQVFTRVLHITTSVALFNSAGITRTQVTAVVDHLTSAYQLKSKDWTTGDEEILNALLRVLSNVPDGMEIKAEHLEKAGMPTIDTHSTTTFTFIVDWNVNADAAVASLTAVLSDLDLASDFDNDRDAEYTDLGMQLSFQALMREIVGTGSGTTLDSLDAKFEELDIRLPGKTALSKEIVQSIGKLASLSKEQKQFELVNGMKLPVSDAGIHVRKVTRIAELWGRKAVENLENPDCKSLLIHSCDDLSKEFKQTAKNLGFTSRISLSDAQKMLIGAKEAAVAMEAQLCAEFRDYGQYFSSFADALEVNVVKVEQPPEMTGSTGASGSCTVVARRAFADKFSGDKKAGRRESRVEITLGPFPAGSKWFQVKALMVFCNVPPNHVDLAVNPNDTMIACAYYQDLASAKAAMRATNGLTIGSIGPLEVQLTAKESARRAAVSVPNDDGPPAWTLNPFPEGWTETAHRAHVPMACLTHIGPSEVACLEWDEDGCMFVSKAEPGTYLEKDE